MTPQQIEAMKLALEALEEINKLSVGENAIFLPAEIDTAMDAIKEALAQPEQEPVALEDVYLTIIQWDIGGGKRSRRELARRIVAKYTTTPQRKPLTDEEVEKIIKTNMSLQMNLAGIRQDFEAAHGIKENT